jgi:hypothetical protein
MEHYVFDQFEVRREQPLQQQQMSALSALLVAVHILWGIKFSKNM